MAQPSLLTKATTQAYTHSASAALLTAPTGLVRLIHNTGNTSGVNVPDLIRDRGGSAPYSAAFAASAASISAARASTSPTIWSIILSFDSLWSCLPAT